MAELNPLLQQSAEVVALINEQQALTGRTTPEAMDALAAGSNRPAGERGVELTPLRRTIDDRGYHYEHVDVAIDAAARSSCSGIGASRNIASGWCAISR